MTEIWRLVLAVFATLVLSLVLSPVAMQKWGNPEDNFGADPGCRDPWSSEWTRDQSDCTIVYFCVLGKVIHTYYCNDTRVWSDFGHACVLPMSQWDDCNIIPTTPVINDPRCLNPDGINPNPENCAQFLACTNRTVLATMNCPENTLFTTRNSTCELAFLVAEECKSRHIPKNIVVSTANPIIDKPCEGTKNGDVADLNNCNRFFKCNHGRVVARIKCPAMSAFSEANRKCDWIASANCGKRPLRY